MFSGISNDALARFADSMSYAITAEAATGAPNRDELSEKYVLEMIEQATISMLRQAEKVLMA